MITRIHQAAARLLPYAMILAVAASGRAEGPGLHGRVLAVDEQGLYTGVVGGAAIEFFDQGGGSAARTTAGANGYYRVDLPAGAYTFAVSADGYKSDDEGRGIEIHKTEGYVVHDFSLVPGQDDDDAGRPEVPGVPVGVLTGRVVEVLENGRRIGVPEAQIALRLTEGRVLRRVTTRATQSEPGQTGAYAVQLPAGEWRASVSAEGFDTLVHPEPIAVPAEGQATREFVLRRSEPETPVLQGISGLVVFPADAPRSPMRVTIESLRQPRADRTPLQPDADGRFTQDLPVGAYRVVAEADGYYPASRGPVSVFAGRYSNVVLRLTPLMPERPTQPDTPAEPLRVIVTVKERTARGLAPVLGARVMLRPDGAPLTDAQRADTNAAGETGFDVVADGTYVALAQSAGFKPGGLRVQVAAGEPNRADIILIRDTPDTESTLITVTGYVAYKDETSPTGYRAVPGTRLIWREANQLVQNIDTDTRGAFRVELAAGRYEVELQPPRGFRSAREPLTVAAGMAAKTFVVEAIRVPDERPAEPGRDVQVSGVVLGAPLARGMRYASVSDATVVWNGPRTQKSVRSDLAGRLSVSLPEGLYSVEVRARGYDPLEQEVVVQPGMESVRLVLTRGSTRPEEPDRPDRPGRMALSVRVMQRVARGQPGIPLLAPLASRPLAGAAVVVLQDGKPVATGQSDEQGRYSVQLPPGRYDVKAMLEGFVPAQEQVALLDSAISTDLVLAPQARPDRPAAGKHTLTLRIVAQSDQPPQTDTPGRRPRPNRALPGTGNESDETESKPSGSSALEQLRDRLERRGGRDRAPTKPAESVSAIAGAAVVVLQGNQTVASGKSDKDGLYRVELEPGMYTVQVSLAGYDTSQQAIRMGNADVTRQVVLTKAAPR